MWLISPCLKAGVLRHVWQNRRFFIVIEGGVLDWNKIRNEYISTNISQRKIAAKYKVSYSTIQQRARKEQWKRARDEQHDEIEAKIRQKTAEKIVEHEVGRIEKILKIGDTLVEKIEKAANQLESAATMTGELINTGVVDTHRLRQIVQSLKDLKEITVCDGAGSEEPEKDHSGIVKAIGEINDD